MKYLKIFSLIIIPTAVFADNENYNSQNIARKDFSDLSLVDSTWRDVNATNTSFKNSNLYNADFYGASLSGASFLNANLSGVDFRMAYLGNVDMTNAIITYAKFRKTDSYGSIITKEQLYSTDSYKNKDLRGIEIEGGNLLGYDFTSQNLTGAVFQNNANEATVIFTDAIINNVTFDFRLEEDQLYSTASYKNKDLSGINFGGKSMICYDFSSQNLQNVNLEGCALGVDIWGGGAERPFSNFDFADLRGANIKNTGIITYSKRNVILDDGIINKISLIYNTDVLRIRKYISANGGDMISAKVNKNNTMSNGSSIILENGADFRIINNAVLTVGEGSRINLSTSINDITSFVVEAGSSLVFDANSILNVNIDTGEDFNHTLTFNIIEWEDTAIVEGLSNLKKNENFTLTLNGKTYTGAWDYIQDTNSLKAILVVPEPSTYAVLFGALVLAFVAYRKRK